MIIMQLQFFGVIVVQEAIRDKITQKRDELQRAKAAVDRESMSIKHLETKVLIGLKD